MSHTLFATYTGKIIDYKNITEDDICLEDIAHHLTNIQRFGGCLPLQVKYSVADHSINCYRMAVMLHPNEDEVHRAALMHDATEAYIGDVVSGLKRCLTDYTKLERHLSNVINEKYNLQEFTRVQDIDKRIMLDEVKSLIPDKYDLYVRHQQYLPYDQIKLEESGNPEVTKQTFLYLCEELGIYD